MDTWIWLAITAFVAFDTAVTMFVLRALRRKRERQAESPATEPADHVAKDVGIHT